MRLLERRERRGFRRRRISAGRTRLVSQPVLVGPLARSRAPQSHRATEIGRGDSEIRGQGDKGKNVLSSCPPFSLSHPLLSSLRLRVYGANSGASGTVIKNCVSCLSLLTGLLSLMSLTGLLV